MDLSPFSWTERIFVELAARDDSKAVAEERNHYEVLLCKHKNRDEFELVVGYLYNRLNIVDQKANSILVLNTFALGALSILFQLGQKSSATQGALPQHTSPTVVKPQLSVLSHPNVTIAVYAATAAALFMGFTISRLHFRHIGAGKETFDTYKTHIFQVTVARQRMLGVARALTATAFVLYSILFLSLL